MFSNEVDFPERCTLAEYVLFQYAVELVWPLSYSMAIVAVDLVL